MTTTNFDQVQFSTYNFSRYHVLFAARKERGIELPYNLMSEHLKTDPALKKADCLLEDLDIELLLIFVRRCLPELSEEYFSSCIGDPIDRKVKKIWKENRVEFVKVFEDSYKEYFNSRRYKLLTSKALNW